MGTRRSGWAQMLLVRGLPETKVVQPHRNSSSQALWFRKWLLRGNLPTTKSKIERKQLKKNKRGKKGRPLLPVTRAGCNKRHFQFLSDFGLFPKYLNERKTEAA